MPRQYQTFTQLIRQAGLDGRGTRARPRPYDLRHAFAVRTVRTEFCRDR